MPPEEKTPKVEPGEKAAPKVAPTPKPSQQSGESKDFGQSVLADPSVKPGHCLYDLAQEVAKNGDRAKAKDLALKVKADKHFTRFALHGMGISTLKTAEKLAK